MLDSFPKVTLIRPRKARAAKVIIFIIINIIIPDIILEISY